MAGTTVPPSTQTWSLSRQSLSEGKKLNIYAYEIINIQPPKLFDNNRCFYNQSDCSAADLRWKYDSDKFS